MERTLVLIRHAKTEWAAPGQSDFDRSLTERGRSDAHMMGLRLKEQRLLPDLIVASPAKRARQTAQILAGALAYIPEKIRWEESLYHCPSHTFEEVITTAVADEVKILFMIGHNPGLTHFVNDTLRHVNLAHVPTCGMVGLQFRGANWQEFGHTRPQFLFFDYPKNQ
jgi:phosphohistidine phosphatase